MISVVVPTYNSEKTILKTMSSILKQTYTKFEVLVVDNHSSDNTRRIVESLNDSRVSFHLVNNKGMPAVSRNYGILLAQFDFVAFCDSDDFWVKDKLQACVYLIDREFDFISHGLQLSGSLSKSFLNRIFARKPAKNFDDFVNYGNHIAQSSVVIRRDILTQMGFYSTDKKFTAVEDAHLWARVLRSGTKLAHINKNLGTYHYSSIALTSTTNQFVANRALRLEYFPTVKPSWYKYNIAVYLIRRAKHRRSREYLKSLVFSRTPPIELRLKAIFLLVRLWGR